MPLYEVFFKSKDQTIAQADSFEELIEGFEGWGGLKVIAKVYQVDENKIETDDYGHKVFNLDLSGLPKDIKVQVWPEPKLAKKRLERKRYLRPERENPSARYLRPKGESDEDNKEKRSE